MALDQATQDYLATLEAQGRPPTHELTPDEARSYGPELIKLIGPGPDVARVQDTTLEADDGTPFAVRVLAPEGTAKAVIVYYHGGGWVIGSIDQFDTLGRQLADRTGCAVVLVDYRKAPEHPYPAAVDDAWHALQWVEENLEEIAGVRVPLIVAGDSAGGNLAAVLAHRARDRSGPPIAYQVLVYPVTNSDLDNRSYLDPANQLLLNRETMVWFWNHYLPDVETRTEPDASPLHAPDRAGLPSALIVLAEHDVLRNEGEAYADGLRRAGVAVEQQTFSGQMHGFFSMVNILPGSTRAIDYIVEHLTEFLDHPTPTKSS